MRIWVVNTSPLVFLGNLGRLELLRHEGREVNIPRAVAEEIAEKPEGILLAAKQRGVIASLRAEINPLVALGLRVNPQLVTAILQNAGE
jgi:predicted nucleic acid-binding protein